MSTRVIGGRVARGEGGGAAPPPAKFYSPPHHSKNVLASDIGLIAKKESGNEFTFFVNNLKTTNPISGAKIKFYDYQQQVYKEISTESDGKVTVTLKETPFIVVAEHDGQKTYMKFLSHTKANILDTPQRKKPNVRGHYFDNFSFERLK